MRRKTAGREGQKRSDGLAAPIWLVSGTRPEVIKLAPLYLAALGRFGSGAVQWISTGQHLALETQMLGHFGIVPHHRLPERADTEDVTRFSLRAIEELTRLQAATGPGLVIVQGDTASTFAGAFAAFHGGIPLAHVEAGLRTHDIHSPYPEEAYRRMTDAMSDLHFAPTPRAAARLAAEGFPAESIFTTGNTAVDALQMIDSMDGEPAAGLLAEIPPSARLLVVTMHRRESWGAPMEDLCHAVRDIVADHPDVRVVLPVHVNPRVRCTVTGILEGVPRVMLTPPLDFLTTHALIRRAQLVLTDSGGITEEAPSYGVPVLILRRWTERPEAVEEGLAELVGTDRKTVAEAARRLLDDPEARTRMTAARNPYGDGRAAERIVLGIERFLSGEGPVLTEEEQFP